MFNNVFTTQKTDLEKKIARTLSLANMFLQNKQYNEAKRYVEEVLEKKPDSSEAYKVLSKINECLNENDLAIQNYKKSLDFKTRQSSFLTNNHLSPTKFLNNSISNETSFQNHSSQDFANAENLKGFEEMINSKLAFFENSLTNFNENSKNVMVLLKKNNDGIASLKQTLFELGNKITSIGEKQNQFEKKFSAQANINNEYLAGEFTKVTEQLHDISIHLAKKIDDLEEKINESNFNETYDEEYEESHKDKIETDYQKPLKEMFTFTKNEWICDVCCVRNDDSSICASCEGPRKQSVQKSPNNEMISQSQKNDFQFKFPQFISTNNRETNLPEVPKLNFANNNVKNISGSVSNFSFLKSESEPLSNSTTNLSKNQVFNQPTAPLSFSNENSDSSFSTFNLFSDPSFTMNTMNSSFINKNSKSDTSVKNFSFSDALKSLDTSKFCFSSNLASEKNEKNLSFDLNQSVELPCEIRDDLVLPKVKLPDNYEHITGEENEVEIFQSTQVKLYVFVNNEYKERGAGVIKILKNKVTSKFRLLMRRDQVYKVCLNSYLTNDIKFETKKKFLFFQCIDFSEENLSPQTFLLKFVDIQSLTDFKNFIDSLFSLNFKELSDSFQRAQQNEDISKNKSDEDCLIVFVKEPKPEHKEKIETLKLPVNFYDYEDKAPCEGCLGCKVDEVSWNDLTQDKSEENKIFFGFEIPQDKFDTIQFDKKSTEEEKNSFISEKSKLLPQDYKHITGEENEEIVFEERAKLFRFVKETNEFKERGVGQIKILRNNQTDDYRLLMRRDIILNIICNHKLSPLLSFKEKTLNSIIWACRDYSETEKDEIFLLKFKDSEKKQSFLKSVDLFSKKKIS